MHTVQFLNHIVQNSHTLAYLIIFLVTIIEGEVVAISAGILIYLGALNFWMCLVLILLGGAVKTFTGYFLGGFLHSKFDNTKAFIYIEKKVSTILPNFNKDPFWSIFISKFILVNHFVLIFSGYKQIDFKRYLKAEFFSTIIWAPLMISAGYFFSFAALGVSRRLSEFLLIVVLCIVGLLLLERFLTFMFNLFQNLSRNYENQGKKDDDKD